MKNLQAYISKLLSNPIRALSKPFNSLNLSNNKVHIPKQILLLIVISFFAFSTTFSSFAKASLSTAANLIESGNDRLKRKEYSEAIEFFRKALEKDLGNPTIHFSLGISYLGDKDLELSTEHFLRGIELNPAMLEAYYSLALCYQMQGKKELALSSFRQGLGIDLDNKLPKSIFWNEVILSNNEEDENRAEIIAYNKQEAEENNGTSLHFPKAELNQSQSNIVNNIYSDIESSSIESYKEELQGYLAELKKSPNDSQLIYRIGLFYLREKNYEKAYQIEKRLEKLDEYLAGEIKNKLGSRFKGFEIASTTVIIDSSKSNSEKVYSKPPEIQSANNKKTSDKKVASRKQKASKRSIFKRNRNTSKYKSKQ